VPEYIFESKAMLVGLVVDPKRLEDIRKTRINLLNDKPDSNYANIDLIQDEINKSKKLFASHKIPTIDVTRKSVEETAAAIVKIYEIKKNA
jgi:regulator of PEP synthase PpsR (kinase-PPPase family)